MKIVGELKLLKLKQDKKFDFPACFGYFDLKARQCSVKGIDKCPVREECKIHAGY